MIVPQPLDSAFFTPDQTLWVSRELRHPQISLGVAANFPHPEWNERDIVRTILVPSSENPGGEIELNEFLWFCFGHDRRTVVSKYRLKINLPPLLDQWKVPVRGKINELVRQDIWSRSLVVETFMDRELVDHNTTLIRDRLFQRTPVQRLIEDIQTAIQDVTALVYR